MLEDETILRVELPDLEGKAVEVQISEDTASALTDAFMQTWEWGKREDEAEDLIAQARQVRDTAYPDHVVPEDLADALREVLDTLLEGRADDAAGDLAAIIDTLEHLGEPEPEPTPGETLQ
jgi:ABC-type amino acid transport substrate-binding protein